jgi:hypothetical protein
MMRHSGNRRTLIVCRAVARTWATGSGLCSQSCCPALLSSRLLLSFTYALLQLIYGLALLDTGLGGTRTLLFLLTCAGLAVRIQVSPSGLVQLVSSVGDKGTSAMMLSGSKGLGPEGAQQLARLLRGAPPPYLPSLNLRYPHPFGYLFTVLLYLNLREPLIKLDLDVLSQ